MMAQASFSPPISPSGPQKRKFAELNLGQSQLSRPVKAQRVHYGIDVHHLLQEAQAEEQISTHAVRDLPTPPAEESSAKPSLLWTEKYRAKKFTDLIGDERTHRAVMHWLKRWDQIVFPGSGRLKAKARSQTENEEKPHRKILLLNGPPGLGKTTLAHVCAKQAGYEVQEINASDERSRDVVKGRIRDMVGTENVKGIDTNTKNGKVRKAGKPVCVIVDEVDGVVGGSGSGGEGGFVKALIDLVTLDQKNSTALGTLSQAPAKRNRGDRFRLLRPMILICNDVYHPSLRPLRQTAIAEVIHVRKPQLQTISSRMHAIFEKEGIPADTDGVRRLCEAVWGVSNRKEDRSGAGAGEGDMRGIMIVGEWVASKFRSTRENAGDLRLTRRWVEEHALSELTHGGGAARGLGRGGPKDIVERVFAEGAGFPKSSIAQSSHKNSFSTGGVKGVAESLKRSATQRLRELLDTHGDTDRITTDVWATYPTHPFQDDTLLSKPNAAYEWMHFHDRLSKAVYTSNDWELAPYLSTPVLAFHHLFASQTRSWAMGIEKKDDADDEPHPFLTSAAPWAASEALKSHTATLQSLHSSLTLPLTRLFPASGEVAADLLPYLLRMLSPNVNPTIIGGSGNDKGTASVRKAGEQALVSRAVSAMTASGVRFERVKIAPEDATTTGGASFVYRMEPALDTLGGFETAGKGFGETAGGKTRYGVRQVLAQEFQKDELKRAEAARMARMNAGMSGMDVIDKMPVKRENKDTSGGLTKRVKVARDFFGRPVVHALETVGSKDKGSDATTAARKDNGRVWVTFHEGFNNAVRKPITLAELMKDL